ncbi:NACHT domain-containing protein [Actinoplanes bogorensis]|uniref:NACHT domain-containing protein n=1 Tax=Paractinoplanes bogorensis TaxID=1610840 RepID=A0ABS5YWM2_9ACTN|nr:NACHT domain-containing protein [Actinoplanes bogorensis]MBU2667839.1 NACHT domain-containing protein [Actinoplanes bogorensis]
MAEGGHWVSAATGSNGRNDRSAQRQAYAEALRALVKSCPGTQAEFATSVHISASHLSSILAGTRLPATELAQLIAGRSAEPARLHRLYAEARGLEFSADEMPAVLTDLLQSMQQVGDELPYLLQNYRRLSLSTLYVRQTVSSPAETQRSREESPEEQGWVEAARRVSTLAQPFDEVFEENDHLVIEGGAGLGKTTLARRLVVRLADGLSDPENSAAQPRLIPLLLPARVLAPHITKPWNAALTAAVADEYGAFSDEELPPTLFSSGVRDHRWLIVIDALDEIPDPVDRDQLITAVARRMSTTGTPARFLITTRPLGLGETARLSGAGFFELQPFDKESLKRFAHHWFDSKGAVAAEHFLEQVRAAGLTEILEVPLLAAIAANAHESEPERPLPSSRYALYEGYIQRFADSRLKPHSDALLALSGDSEVAQRLGSASTSLFEHLAVQYLAADTPLREVAATYLTDRQIVQAPLPPARHEALMEWLTQSGLLIRSGHRLRFLHQTFAEHLAATAQAKDLPDSFDIALPVWSDLIRGLSLEDDATSLVVLHYLHLGKDSDGIIRTLLSGTIVQRYRAGDLIAQGAPCLDERLDEYLAYLTKMIATSPIDLDDRLRKLGGLLGRQSVRSWLVGLLSMEPPLDYESNIAVVDLLREHAPEAWHIGIELLTGYLDKSCPRRQRHLAARTLTKFGGETRGRATEALRTLSGPRNTKLTRFEAADALAKLGTAEHEEAARVLESIVSGPSDRHGMQVEAARELAKLGGLHRDRGLVLLTQIAESPMAADERVAAAESLAGLSRQHRDAAVAALVDLCDRPEVPKQLRAEALGVLCSIDPARREWAAHELALFAASPVHGDHDRQRAAVALGKLGRSHRSAALTILTAISSDPTLGGYVRKTSAEAVADLGRSHRSKAIVLLEALVRDVTLTESNRSMAMRALIRLGPEAYPAATQAMREIVTDPGVSHGEWLSTAQLLANMGAEARDGILELCHSLVGSSAVSPDRQAHAAALLATVDVTLLNLAKALISQSCRSISVSRDTAAMAADLLDYWGDHATATAIHERWCNDVVDFHERSYSAFKVVHTDHNRQDVGVRTLTLQAFDPTIDLRSRWGAIDRLVRCGPEAVLTMSRAAAASLSSPVLGHYPFWSDMLELPEAGLDEVLDLLTWHLAAVEHSEATDRIFETLADAGADRLEAARQIVSVQAADKNLNADQRRVAASLLMRTGTEGRESGSAFLRAMTTDSTLAFADRCLALRQYITFSGSTGTVEPLSVLAQERPATSDAAACDLAAIQLLLGSDHRSLGIATLKAIAADHMLHAAHRLQALTTLLEDGAEKSDDLARPLIDLSSSPSTPPDVRLRAWGQLRRLGGPSRATQIKLVTSFATDPATQPSIRIAAGRVLVGNGSEALRELGDTLSRLSDDRTVDSLFRVTAAGRLTKLGQPYRAQALSTLHDISAEQTADGWSRYWAAEMLSRFDLEGRADGLALLEQLAREDLPDPVPAILARVDLTCADDTRVAKTSADLLTLAADRTRPGRVRLEAVEGQMRISPHSHDSAIAALRTMADDSALCGWERRLAAMRLTVFSWETRTQATQTLTRLASDDSVGLWERIDAAAAAARLDESLTTMHAFLRDAGEDRNLPSHDRRHAASSMLKTSRLLHERANAILADLAADVAVEGEQRRWAGELLAGPGRERVLGLSILENLTRDEQQTPGTRVRTWRTLDHLNRRYRTDAVAALNAILGDAKAPPAAKREAARYLMGLPVEFHDLAVDVLWSLANDTATTAADRALAVGTLAVSWQADRTSAGAQLVDCAATSDEGIRMEIATVLVDLDPRHRWESHRLRYDLITGADDQRVRLQTALSLAKNLDGVNIITDLRPDRDLPMASL